MNKILAVQKWRLAMAEERLKEGKQAADIFFI